MIVKFISWQFICEVVCVVFNIVLCEIVLYGVEINQYYLCQIFDDVLFVCGQLWMCCLEYLVYCVDIVEVLLFGIQIMVQDYFGCIGYWVVGVLFLGLMDECVL